MIAIVVLSQLVGLIVFQSSFLLIVTFYTMLRRHICLTRSCDFAIKSFFFKFHCKYERVIGNINNVQPDNCDTASLRVKISVTLISDRLKV